MQDADELELDVAYALEGVDEQRGLQLKGHGVDGEVAAGQVVVEGGGLYLGQGAWVGVGLATSAGQIEVEAVAGDAGGTEAGVQHGFAGCKRSQRLGNGSHFTHHGEV